MPNVSKAAMIIVIGMSLFVGFYASTGAIGDYRLSYLAVKILRGDIIQNAALKDALLASGDYNRSCATPRLSDSVIVRLRLLENFGSLLHTEHADLELTTLSSESHDLLACQPTTPFTWLLQFWLNTISGRSDVLNWKFLERSYEAGLYEGWVATRRSQIAIASFDFAPESLQNKALQEFKSLLEYKFVDDGVRLYASASGPAKRRLGEAVRMLGGAQRQSFTSRLGAIAPSELLIDTLGEMTNGASLRRRILP